MSDPITKPTTAIPPEVGKAIMNKYVDNVLSTATLSERVEGMAAAMSDVANYVAADKDDQIARLTRERDALRDAAKAIVRGIDRLHMPTVETALGVYIVELEDAIALVEDGAE